MSVQYVPTVADLNEIVEQVWASYLDPEGVNPLIPVESAADASDIHASVSITGSWHGHVVVACSNAAGKLAAAAFLAMEPEEVTEADLIDVLGELANIVGGNVKSMLPAGCFVSLPHVVSAPAQANHWPAAVQVCELAGLWSGESIAFSMWQSRELTGEAAA
ncbi:chemotaxis protein CheX [Micromonospora pattaloongensis]|uniref:Chemotaxis protein CheX n=1 Tax=Micromonospora pattaloongensis TaxID=405436 RepID=A0A1H3N1A4_9ACTN|nr:chemotaxis protein CheX [Micromonospora pattaloongensis]SDY82019.1 chemotaxis protein CheX [Micromonospora pattaloongensis]